MTTIEGNKLIVKDRSQLALVEKFMGYADGYLSEIITWNDVMPVVEKIESLDHKGFPINVTISGDGACIYISESNWTGAKYEGKKEIVETLNINYWNVGEEPRKTKIQGTWKAVVEFIQWFNSVNLKREEQLTK